MNSRMRIKKGNVFHPVCFLRMPKTSNILYPCVVVYKANFSDEDIQFIKEFQSKEDVTNVDCIADIIGLNMRVPAISATRITSNVSFEDREEVYKTSIESLKTFSKYNDHEREVVLVNYIESITFFEKQLNPTTTLEDVKDFLDGNRRHIIPEVFSQMLDPLPTLVPIPSSAMQTKTQHDLRSNARKTKKRKGSNEEKSLFEIPFKKASPDNNKETSHIYPHSESNTMDNKFISSSISKQLQKPKQSTTATNGHNQLMISSGVGSALNEDSNEYGSASSGIKSQIAISSPGLWSLDSSPPILQNKPTYISPYVAGLLDGAVQNYAKIHGSLPTTLHEMLGIPSREELYTHVKVIRESTTMKSDPDDDETIVFKKHDFEVISQLKMKKN